MGNQFQRFGSVLEAEVLDEQQMNSLEAGGNCDWGCKKSCQPGNQNENKKVTIKLGDELGRDTGCND